MKVCLLFMFWSLRRMEIIDIIDASNKVIGREKIDNVHKKHLAHRTSHVLIFNNTGQIFLQLRGPKVRVYPGYWTSSAAGHVSAGTTYYQTARRELAEELGVKCRLKKIGFFWIHQGPDLERCEVFIGKHNGPFKFQKKEVAGGKFYDIEFIRKNYKKLKTCPFFQRAWEVFKEFAKDK